MNAQKSKPAMGDGGGDRVSGGRANERVRKYRAAGIVSRQGRRTGRLVRDLLRHALGLDEVGHLVDQATQGGRAVRLLVLVRERSGLVLGGGERGGWRHLRGRIFGAFRLRVRLASPTPAHEAEPAAGLGARRVRGHHGVSGGAHRRWIAIRGSRRDPPPGGGAPARSRLATFRARSRVFVVPLRAGGPRTSQVERSCCPAQLPWAPEFPSRPLKSRMKFHGFIRTAITVSLSSRIQSALLHRG